LSENTGEDRIFPAAEIEDPDIVAARIVYQIGQLV
jgi:hypothetical protein